MSPLIALEPLGDAVFALAGAIVLLSLALQVERAVAAFQERRAGRKEALLTELVYRVIQGELCIAEVAALSRLERRVARGILLRLAPDLRGESSVGIAELYRGLGLLEADLKRMRSWRAITRAHAAADLGLVRAAEALPALTKALDDPDVRVRQASVWALGQAGGPDTLAALVRVLGDSDVTVARPKARDMAVLVGAAVLEHLGYRQLTVWWRVRAFWEYWRGDLSWGAMERRGVGAA
jgi:hypothetical protein